MNLKVEIFKNESDIPEAIRSTLKVLHDSGHEAFLAGGCVRDALLGLKPKDFDIATDATPDQIEKLFTKTISVGKEFGVMVVVIATATRPVSIEVATFRSDGEYSDGRRPESVTFSSPKEDASRRDFTINGLFYNVRENAVVDYVGGYEDLQKKTVRTIGDAKLRFAEDKLRILRAVRFATELSFEIETETKSMIQQMAPELSAVSAERITQEITKMLGGRNPGTALATLSHLRLSNIIFKSFSIFASPQFFELLKFSLGLNEKDSTFGWLLLGYYEWRSLAHSNANIQPVQTDTHIDQVMFLFDQFRLSRDLLRTIEASLKNWDAFHSFDTAALLILNENFGLTLFQLATVVNITEATLQGKPLNSGFDLFLKRYQSLSGSDGRLEAPWLNGNDLAAAGIPKGPAYKDMLREAYMLQLNRTLGSREDSLKWIRSKVS